MGKYNKLVVAPAEQLFIYAALPLFAKSDCYVYHPKLVSGFDWPDYKS